MKSHGICPACLPAYEARVNADLKRLSRAEGNAKPEAEENQNKEGK
jgi:hypothetical protein